MRGVALTAAAALAASQPIQVIQSSEDGDKWAPLPNLQWGNDFDAAVSVVINASARYQTIMGFGAALTDSAAFNFLQMNETLQQQFLAAHFDYETGLGYTVGRVAINSPDYALETFNYDNVTDDFSLSYFDHNLTYDTQRVIPFIKAVQGFSRDPVRLFASPWSPPGWMKSNNNMISCNTPCLKNDTANGSYAQAWADYFVLWFRGMENHGITFWGLTPQNEPLVTPRNYEGCRFMANDMSNFIMNHLGPTLKAPDAYPNLKIMVFDNNKLRSLDYLIGLYYYSPNLSLYVDGTAVHWYDYNQNTSFGNLDAIHALNESQFILGTEACYLQSLLFGWKIGALYALDILGDLNHWAIGWTEWNIILHHGDPSYWEGGPNHDNTTHFGSSALLVSENNTNSLLFQPSYYTIGHVSKYVRPGSTRVGISGQGIATTDADYNVVRAWLFENQTAPYYPLVASAFISPNGTSAIVVILNPSDSSATFKLADVSAGAPRAANVTMPGNSIRTFIYDI